MPSDNPSSQKLYGEELVKAVKQNSEKDWLEIIEKCGYLGSGFCISSPNGWKPVEFLPRIQLFREFYTEYVNAAEAEIRKAYEVKYWNKLNWDEEDGPISEGTEAKKLFQEVINERQCEVLAPSFWQCEHGRLALIMTTLGGYWFQKKYDLYESIHFRAGYLCRSLLGQGIEEDELDVLGYFKRDSSPNIVENALHWTLIFKLRHPELKDALLGEQLKAKWNDLQKRQVPRDQAAYECGFYDPSDMAESKSKRRRPNLEAFGFALNCSLSKSEIYLKEDGRKFHSGEVERNTNPPSQPGGWPSEVDWDLDEPQTPSKSEQNRDNLDDLHDQLNRQGLATENQHGLITYQKLVGQDLVNKCIEFHHEGIAETSICIRTGYKTEFIGSFRRAFSKASGAKLAPLARMIAAYNQDENSSLNITQERKFSSSSGTFRLRSGNFRDSVIGVHGAECQACSMKVLDLIEAAHIVPVANDGVDHPSNGLPLCPTHHSAFDRYLFAFDPIDKSVVFKDGLNSSMLGITKMKVLANVSNEALEIQYDLFRENNES
tara:strand:+ start:999 stop:2636 length:1638 start_codon:yes stop_codon:yes gene_type:complete